MDRGAPAHPLRLSVPHPGGRPGDGAHFSDLLISPAGAVARPPVDVDAADIVALASQLIRVLDDDGHGGRARGPAR